LSAVIVKLQHAFRAVTDFRESTVVVSGDVERRRATPASLMNPFYWISQVANWIVRWVVSRQPEALAQGLPAIIGLVSPLVLVNWLTPTAEQLITGARSRRDYFVEQRDFEKADFFARQMCALVPDDPDVLLGRARLLYEKGDTETALLLASRIESERQDLNAVLWLAERDMQSLTVLSPENADLERRLMARVLFLIEKNPHHVQANFMLGTLHLMKGRFSSAIPPLTEAVIRSPVPIPEAEFSLAVAYDSTGQSSQAVPRASRAADYLLTRMTSREYDQKLMIQTLRALMLARRESEAVSLIEEEITRRGDQEQKELKWVLGDVHAYWCRRLRTTPARTASDLAMAMGVIHRGLLVAPGNSRVLEELTELTCSTELEDREILQQLDVALQSGVSPGLVHFVLGTRELLKDPPNTSEALGHLEIAKSHDSQLPGLLNNIADAIVRREDGDPQQALVLVEQAMEMMPAHPYFHDTRGRAYLRMKEFVKAIADLERALAAEELRAEAHELLAECYVELNNSEEARRNLELAGFYKLKEDQERKEHPEVEP
jgi:Flp pilus assembly protein TadD